MTKKQKAALAFADAAQAFVRRHKERASSHIDGARKNIESPQHPDSIDINIDAIRTALESKFPGIWAGGYFDELRREYVTALPNAGPEEIAEASKILARCHGDAETFARTWGKVPPPPLE